MQWLPEPESEPTSTYVMTSPGLHFVDIRILNSSYPIDSTHSQKLYEEVFDWVLTGTEQEVTGTNEIKFVLEIDSLEVGEAKKANKPLSECRRPTDLGFFHSIPNSEDRKETGNMLNPSTGKKQDYVEVWRSLDPAEHTPSKEVREPSAPVAPLPLYVLTTQLDKYEGKVVRLGNWMQGLVHDKSNHDLHVVRSWYNGEKWEHQIKYGDLDLFHLEFYGKKGDEINGKVSWKCIE